MIGYTQLCIQWSLATHNYVYSGHWLHTIMYTVVIGYTQLCKQWLLAKHNYVYSGYWLHTISIQWSLATHNYAYSGHYVLQPLIQPIKCDLN